ncbi:MAG: hypothetical protein GXY33_05085 [Phycisphaerae bacterium]|nr:hypothetical protein [Phycisphaerae bacterium]
MKNRLMEIDRMTETDLEQLSSSQYASVRGVLLETLQKRLKKVLRDGPGEAGLRANGGKGILEPVNP